MADDFDQAGDDIARRKALRDAGRNPSDGTADHFHAGYEAGRDASNPDLPTTTRDVVERIRREYTGDEDARAAYRDGYAAGANRNR